MKCIAKYISVLFILLNFSTYGQTVEKERKKRFNLLESELDAIALDKSKRKYVVFSDRASNTSYKDCYATERYKEVAFMDSFYVIDKKNDFYELVTYNPKQIGKPKGLFSFFKSKLRHFKDKEQIDYIGWVHKDNLLSYATPKITTKNFKPVRYITAHQNVETLSDIKKFSNKDTIYLYKGPSLKEKAAKALTVGQFVYLYKYSVDRAAVLVSTSPHLITTISDADIHGWLPVQLLAEAGQQQVYKLDADAKVIDPSEGTTTVVSPDELTTNYLFSKQFNAIAASNPATDTTNVIAPLYVWKHTDKLINVNGNDISKETIGKINEESQWVNIHYIFDCDSDLHTSHLTLLSSLQKISLLLEEKKIKTSQIRYSAQSYGCQNTHSFPLSTSFSKWIDFIKAMASTETNTIGKRQSFTQAISQTLDDVSGTFNNNFFIVVGAEDFLQTNEIETLAQQLSERSSKLLFYQAISKSEDSYQNFILDAKSLLEETAKASTTYIKEFSVDISTVKASSSLIRLPSEDNIYIFDAPSNSSYQGGIIFPKLGNQALPQSFDTAIDSVISMTLNYNTLLKQSLKNYVTKFSFIRSNPRAKIQHLITDTISITKNDPNEMFLKQYHVLPSEDLHAGYFLTDQEISGLIESYRLFIPYISGEVKRKNKRWLRKKYIRNLKNYNAYVLHKKLRSNSTVGELLFQRTGIPVYNKDLRTLRIKDLMRLEDEVFKGTLDTLRLKIQELEKFTAKEKPVYDDGGSYYFLPVELTL